MTARNMSRPRARSITPAPWLNVIANPYFGFQDSESGSGYTWSQNSRENQLTPWSNDPVSDPVGEAIYVRDEESGEFWRPTPADSERRSTTLRGMARATAVRAMHDGISSTSSSSCRSTTGSVSVLTVENRSGRARRLRSRRTRNVLRDARGAAGRHGHRARPETGAILARDPWNMEFRVGSRSSTWAVRQRNGPRIGRSFSAATAHLARPAGLERGRAS